MSKKSLIKNLTLRELITSFGFFEGFWLAIGIDPEAKILGALTKVLIKFHAGPTYILLLKILPIIILIGTLFLIHHLGGKLGFIAVILAFFSGLLILNSPLIAICLFLMALYIGNIAEK